LRTSGASLDASKVRALLRDIEIPSAMDAGVAREHDKKDVGIGT